MEPPHRAIELEIKIGADNLDDVFQVFRVLEFTLHEHPVHNFHVVSGGYNNNYEISGEYYPEMTHEKYSEQVKRFLGRNDA